MTARAAAAQPFAAAADLLAELAGIRLSAKRIERSAETDGAAVAAADHRRVARDRARQGGRAARVRPTAARHAGQALHRHRRHRRADGGGRGRRPGRQERRRPGPHPRGQTRLPVHPNHPRRTRPAGARPRLHQLPGQLRPRRASSPPWWRAEARRRGAEHIRQLVVLGDGAPWIWKLATAVAPEATPIVDIYHAREHLHALAASSHPPSAISTRTG